MKLMLLDALGVYISQRVKNEKEKNIGFAAPS